MANEEALLMYQKPATSAPHYEPYGWQQWPEHPYLSYQFRRALGETQEGGGAVSECFQAASRMKPGDKESWHDEWVRVADRNRDRGDEAQRRGHIRTAMNCWLRAANYYRHAEFWLPPHDLRRLKTFTQCELMSHKFLAHLDPPGEVIEVPYENGKTLYAYFVRSPYADGKQPVLMSCGGLDSFKDELWFMTGRGAVQRGMSVLMFDGPGQGGTLRRHGLPTRHDYEVPVGYCIDYLATRNDVDMKRIALSGSSLGGFYAARAGCYEPRLAACISHGGNANVYENYLRRDESHEMAYQIKWVYGANSMDEVKEKARAFQIGDGFRSMKCPYLIVHGAHDVNGVERARKAYESAKSQGVDVTLRFVTAEDTGADHCQHDNPTLGQEVMLDWLADRFGIDQTKLGRIAA
ncbi:MAG: alpha/beta hydrolase family protein [Rhodospirillaceae bacterium]